MEKIGTEVQGQSLDDQSEGTVKQIGEYNRVLANRIEFVKTVLVILSSRGMVFDVPALRQKILLSYPTATVYFDTAGEKALGSKAPSKVDLLIDLTAPGSREGFFRDVTLRRKARVAIGRNAGWFRKKIYNRIYDEKNPQNSLPKEMLELERFVQKRVLDLAGVPFLQFSDTPPDKGKTIALELPGMRRI